MAGFTYLLCVLTAVGCAVLLTRGYRASGTRLLFWSALCFWGLSLTNALVVLDLLVITNHDLYGLRLASGFLSVAVLVFGMVWESR